MELYIFISLLVIFVLITAATLWQNRSLKKKLQELEINQAGNERELNLKSEELLKSEEVIGELREALSRLEKDAESSKTKHETLKVNLDTFHKLMKVEFENISNEILKKQSESLSRDSGVKVTEILKPFKDELDTFKNKVSNTLKDNAGDQAVLKNLIEPLNRSISHLTKALKGDFKARGDWGETVLEGLLQISGFKEDVHYTVQGRSLGLKSETGHVAKPDFIFNLPEKRKVIIDVKTTVKHALDYISSDEQSDKEKYLESHLISTRKHIKDLSEKNYPSLENLEGSLDFVVMFIPNDYAFFTTLANDDKIQSFALEKKVMMLSPSLILPFLQIIRNFWRIHEIDRNAMKISDESGRMYDKLVGFLDDFSKVRNSLGKATQAFNDAEAKLSTGRGSVITKAEQIKSFGAKTRKSIPEKFIKTTSMPLKQGPSDLNLF